MRRAAVSVGMLAAMLGMYRFNPDVAWIALFSTTTIALARHIRQ
jgi:hypothetical protein